MGKQQLYYPTDLVIKLTDYCPNNCMGGKYCFAQNSPRGKNKIDRDKISGILEQAKTCGLINVIYFSAEPFADFDLLLYVTKAAHDAGLKPRFLDTSGYGVGKSLKIAEKLFGQLKDAGFDVTIEEGYIGTQYNGFDVSVDQFHPISAEHCANTILGARNVFGPTKYLGMRVTHPSEEFNDDTKKNRTIELLIQTGEVTRTCAKRHEVYFSDGSILNLVHLRMHDSGFAKRLAKEQPGMFDRQVFTMDQLTVYKDLRELQSFGTQRVVLPFHKLYLDPDGQTYPCLSRLPCFSGGNAYEKSIQDIIQDINDNPLLPVTIAEGCAGLLKLIQEKTLMEPSFYATGPSTVGNEFFENDELMEQIKAMISEQGSDKELRDKLVPALVTLREKVALCTKDR